MVKGDIVKYIHRPGREFYGVVIERVDHTLYRIDVLTRHRPRQEWADGFGCSEDKLELVEGV